jgi:hypothetical protein
MERLERGGMAVFTPKIERVRRAQTPFQAAPDSVVGGSIARAGPQSMAAM